MLRLVTIDEDRPRTSRLTTSPNCMMRSSLLLLPLLGACQSTPEPLLEPINKVALVYGLLEHGEKDEFEPVEEQDVTGVVFTFMPSGTGFGGEVGYSYAKDDDETPGRDVEGKTYQCYGGMRYSHGSGRFRPYGSGGLSYATIYRDTDPDRSRDEDDDDWGVYLAVGADFWVTDRVAIGLEYRMVIETDLDIFEAESEYSFQTLAVTLGFGF